MKPKPIQKWQYYTVSANQYNLEDDELDRLGNEGWELAGVTESLNDGNSYFFFIFKRPKV